MARLDSLLRLRMLPAVSVTCIAALLAACNQHAAAEHRAQVVATVNDSEITLGELKAAIDALGTDTDTLVESLIDEELLAQKALVNHLDRDPAVVQAIEHARRQVLARAYEERSVLPHTGISAASSQEYYRDNPALFAHRRIYRTLTFSIARGELTGTLRNALDRARSAIQVRELLDRQHVAFEAVETTRPAEEIPTDLLAQLAQAAKGDVLIAAPAQQARALLICVVDIRESPIDFEHARPQISQHLTDLRNRAIVAQYLQRARAQARISYASSGDVAVASASKGRQAGSTRLE